MHLDAEFQCSRSIIPIVQLLQPEDRRDRLKKILARREVEKEDEAAVQSLLGTRKSGSVDTESHSTKSGSKRSKKFYIPASSGLIKFRKSIAQETFKRL